MDPRPLAALPAARTLILAIWLVVGSRSASAAALEPARSETQPQPRLVNTLPLVSKDAPPPLIWRGRGFSGADYAVALAGGAATLTAAIATPRAQHSLGGNLGFDQRARRALRADTLSLRYAFRDASDVGVSLAVTWPFMADALTTAWWYRGSREVAREMSLISLQTLAVIAAIQGTTNVLVSRERPYGRDCGSRELPGDALDCTGTVHYRSFFSGHSAFAFTGAALVCSHHFENELLGPPWDAVSCGGAYAVAATTATFRVVGDMHYTSDVLTGALLGTLVGYTVPLLHYRSLGGGNANLGKVRRVPSLSLVPAPGGVGVVGVF